ncbi:Endoplasmic reticulum aminopeptidase 1 [Mactra antiquata]
MSDNEIEDVSFLPGESLHRRGVYEPNWLQKLRLVACTKGRAAVIVTISCLFLLVFILIGILSSSRNCSSNVSTESYRHEEQEPEQKTTQDYIATNGKPFPYREIRLPEVVIPQHYTLFLHPNISKSIFTGTVRIKCAVKEPTDFIVFHVKDLNISKLEVYHETGGSRIPVTEWLEYKTNEQIYVSMGTTLTRDSKFVLFVEFRADLVKKLAGFYKSVYKTPDGQERYIATTHFEPTDARAAFPCFDEPDMKATFELSMVRDKNYISLFNMPLVKSEPFGNGLVKDSFQETVLMSTYLVAFVVCDYKNVSKSTRRNVMVRVFAPEHSIHAAQFALDTAVKVIDYYEDFFGVNYPLPKQDLIAIPDFAAGAMENWGLITYRETAVLYDPLISAARNKQRVAVVIAHELAHQWFGNLVTMKWWDDLWLNEGFASYVEYIGSGIIDEQWHMDDQFVLDASLNALYLDCLENSHPINLPVDNPNQINEMFDTITYDKGASIIRMLSNYLGDDVFKSGLTSYLKRFKYKNAASNDLWTSLSQAVVSDTSDVNVRSLMRTWTEQMGYPVITLTRSGSKVTIKQERFLLYKPKDRKETFQSPFGYLWEVPFSYTTAENPNKVNKMLLKDGTSKMTVAAGISWIKGNSGFYGYYRVNYDDAGWKGLIQQLHKNHSVFSVRERASMIDDVFMLARAGLVKYDTALDLSVYIVNEEDYIPWQTLLDNMKFIESRIEDKPVYTNYRLYMLKLMKNLLSKVVWTDSGSMLDKYLRAAILNEAINLDDDKSINKGREFFETWKQNHRNINVNLKSVIYKTGIKFGKEEDWDAVWNTYLKESDASEKMKLLSALGMSKDFRLLSRFLNYGMNESFVKSQDAFRVLTSIANTYNGQYLAWRFFRQNWDVYFKRYGSTSFIMSSVIKSVCSRFATQFDYDEVKMFFSERDTGTGGRAISQSLEKIQANINWMILYEDVVTDWLVRHG